MSSHSRRQFLTASAAGAAATIAMEGVADAASAPSSVVNPTPVACVAAANVATASGLNTYDGYTLTAGEIVLLTAQTTASQNGPWVAASGAWARPSSFATRTVVNAQLVVAIQGTVYQYSLWLLDTNSTVTVDATPQRWVNMTPQLRPNGYLSITDLSDTSEVANLKFQLRPRTAGGIGLPVPTFYPTTANAPIALDIMPNGPVNYSQPDSGPAHIDVCSADCLTTTAPTAVARVSILRAIDDGASGHVEFSSHDYTKPTPSHPDIWLNPGSASSVSAPQIKLHRPRSAAGTVTLGADNSKVVGRVTRKVVAVTQSATPAINTDTLNVASIVGLTQAITSMTSNLSGSPVDGDDLFIRITDNGTARAITWGSAFEASTVRPPTATVASAMLITGFFWNIVTRKWRCVTVA